MHALNEKPNSAENTLGNQEVPVSVFTKAEPAVKQAKSSLKQKNADVQSLPLPELFELHREELHDFIIQLVGKEEVAGELLKRVYSQARERFASEHYQKFARIWLLRITVQAVDAQMAEWRRHKTEGLELPLKFLSLDEAKILLLRERMSFSKKEIAMALEITEGAVQQRLMEARERAARHLLRWHSRNPFSFGARGNYQSLKFRILVNRVIDGEAQPAEVSGDEVLLYRRGLEEVRAYFQALVKHAAPVIAYEKSSDRVKQAKQQISGRFSWRALPWHYKLGFECTSFAVVGAMAVFVLPTFLSYYGSNDGDSKRKPSQQMIMKPLAANAAMDLNRGPAFHSANDPSYRPVEDEFAYAEFPSGDNHLEGSAPVAPSRNGGAIYRLIVKSENPRELIPRIKTLFTEKNVTERDRSGSQMPGGVYFDAITTEDNYSNILTELSQIAPTKPYQNNRRKGRGDERARVIIWVQQI
jgi:DNA-directed RNA polymerase specialized sigma24 family protein